jgi:hypothetical protein
MKRAISTALGLCIVGVLYLTAAPAARQASDKSSEPQWLQLTLVGVQPGMSADWRKIEQEEVLPALKKGGSPGREVWTTAVFGTGFQFAVVTPIVSFAQFDGQNPLARALGPEGAAAVGGRRAKLETGRRTYAMRARPDLSYRPDATRPPKLALVTMVEVANGRAADFETLIKNDALPAMKKAQVKGYGVFQVVLGGSTNEYHTVVSYDTFEEIGKGHPFEIALGPAGAAKLMQKSAGIVTRVERFVVRYVPDLSFVASKTTSND